MDSTSLGGPASIDIVVEQLVAWRDADEPMMEAIGNTLAEYHRCDSQEQAPRHIRH